MSNAKAQIQAILEISKAFIEAAQEAGPLGVPEGPLYASVMSIGVDLPTFQFIVDLCVKSGKLKRAGNHTLVAVQ